MKIFLPLLSSLQFFCGEYTEIDIDIFSICFILTWNAECIVQVFFYKGTVTNFFWEIQYFIRVVYLKLWRHYFVLIFTYEQLLRFHFKSIFKERLTSFKNTSLNVVLQVKKGVFVIKAYTCWNLRFDCYRSSSLFVRHNVNKVGESCSHTYELAGI